MDYSEITTIRNQFQAGQWKQFLEMIEIRGLRGWTGQSVNLNYPVVAVVGENGSGKSTLLKAAACAYENKDKKKSFYPSTFFIETHWDRIQNVTLNYRIKQGANTRPIRITKPSKRWSLPENRPTRSVRLYDISRTLPLDATVGYAKIARSTSGEASTKDIESAYRERLSHILGKNYLSARFAISDVDQKREIGLLGMDFGEISQFHQGAGEDATLDFFMVAQNIPDSSLLIIDEVEASLHPKAQRRLIRFLLWLSRQKRIQVILSTHSPYVLQELPQEARILLLPGSAGLNIVYGVTPEFAMSRIDEDIHPDIHVFVEDKEASIFLREILASDQNKAEILGRIDIFPVGPANVVQMLGQLGYNRKLPFSTIAFIDGDYEETQGCIRLPGDAAPERVVYRDLKNANWPDLPLRFGIGAGTILGILDDAILEPDHHKWNTIIGDRIIKSSASVWEILCSQWCRVCLKNEDRERIYNKINELIGLRNGNNP